MPTFKYFKGGKEVDSYIGADIGAIQDKIVGQLDGFKEEPKEEKAEEVVDTT